MKKLENSLLNWEKALQSLQEAVATPPVESRDYGGIVQAFVSVYELTWKTLKLVLEVNGIQAPFPRIVFEESFKAGMLEGNEIWKAMMEARNLSMHTYDRELAITLCESIKKNYLNVLQKTFDRIKYDRRS